MVQRFVVWAVLNTLKRKLREKERYLSQSYDKRPCYGVP